MITSGFFNTSNPAPEDLKSAAEILAGALAAAAAVADDSQAAADAAEAAQGSAAAAAGSAVEAGYSLAGAEAARAAAGAALVAAMSAADAAESSVQDADAKADEAATAAGQAVATLEAVQAAQGAVEAARVLAQGYRDSASGYALDAAAAQSAATASAFDAAGSATAADDARGAAQDAATAAQNWADAAEARASDAEGYAQAAEGFADAAQGSATAASMAASTAQTRAAEAANAASAAETVAATASSAATVAAGAAGTAGAHADAAEASAVAAAESAADASAAAEAASGGGIKISATDTTPELLDASVTVSGGLTKAVINPGANERLALGLGAATTSAQGAMSAADKTKLDALPAAASIATKDYADNAAAVAVAAVIDAAPAELDTLREIAGHLADAADITAGIVTAVALKADKTYVDNEIAALADVEHTHAFAELTGKPTTLGGYGITDAAPSSHVGSGEAAHAAASTTAAGFMSATDKVKLNGIAAGAQVNAVTGVFGRTGTVVGAHGDYTASQITYTPAGGIAATTVQAALNELDLDKAATADVTAVLAGKADVEHTHDYSELTGTPTFITQPPGDNSTAVATTEFVQSAVVASTAGVTSFNARTGAVTLANTDVVNALVSNVAGRAILLNAGNAAPGSHAGVVRILAASAVTDSSGSGGYNGGGIDITAGNSSPGSNAANGGAVRITGGIGRWTGAGGDVSLTGGVSTSGLAGPRGGNVALTGGVGYDTGGAIFITGGACNLGTSGPVSIAGGVSSSGPGGAVNIKGGAGGTDQNGGDIVVTPGSGSGTGSAGVVRIVLGASGNMIITGLKMTATGLPSGALWNDGGTLRIAS